MHFNLADGYIFVGQVPKGAIYKRGRNLYLVSESFEVLDSASWDKYGNEYVIATHQFYRKHGFVLARFGHFPTGERRFFNLISDKPEV